MNFKVISFQTEMQLKESKINELRGFNIYDFIEILFFQKWL